MTKTEAKKIIKQDLAPRYERARDSVIEYVIREGNILRELRIDFTAQEQLVNGKENPQWRKHYVGFYGYHDKKTKKEVEGTYYKDIPKKYRMMLNSSEKDIKKHYTNEYKEILNNLVEVIYNDIKAFNPKAIELGESEHDINFTLTDKKGKRQSYTINTILAGGLVQVLHNRTLRKLHAGVVELKF